MMKEDTIKILGARVHNLKNIDLEIPRRKLVVVTGLSGSGKSSLAFDTIYAEGQRRYMETLSTYARQFVGTMERPDVDKITGLSPVVAIEQKTTNKNPRSTVGTVTEINDFLRLLYARASRAYSPVTGEISTIIAEEGELVGSGYPVVAILDMSDLWVTFNVKETLLPGLRIGTRMNGYVPALDSDVEFEVTYISPQADFATWSATRTQGGFDIRTFAIKAKAVTEAANMRPGMSVLVDWDQIGK